MCREAGIWRSGSKRALSAGLLNWRARCRARGQTFLAEMRSLAKARPSCSLFASKFCPEPKSFWFCPCADCERLCWGECELCRPIVFAFSRTTLFGFLSSLIPRNTACRNRSSRVHSLNLTWQNIDGPLARSGDGISRSYLAVSKDMHRQTSAGHRRKIVLRSPG
jgi:hypothetical protein